MQVFDLIRHGRLRTAGALCATLALLVFVTGCPILFPPPPCTETSCDDGLFCNGTETCNADGVTCDPGTAQCTGAGETCSETNDRCEVCAADGDCDDSDACTTDVCTAGQCANNAVPGCCATAADCDNADACDGAETCVANSCVDGTALDCDDSVNCTTDTCDPATGCDNAPVVCPVGQECDETDGDCVDIIDCVTDSDCNTDPCTAAETCVDGLCVPGTPSDCDDGNACTIDTCDAATGDPVTGCVNTTVVCDVDETCNPTTGVCEPPQCTTDAECPDDGLFCTGTESCTAGFCVSSGDPCTAPATCNEALNDCVSVGDEFDLTLNIDDLNGTGEDDTFSALPAFNEGTGSIIGTFQSSDNVNGGDGDDRLNATLRATAAADQLITATLTDIEILTFTDIGTLATTLTGTNWTGVDEVNSSNTTNANALIINNLANIVDVGLSNTTTGFNVGFQSAATSGTDDTLNLALNNAGNTTTDGIVTITTGGTNGFENLNITASGVNVIEQITQSGGTTLDMITIAGAGSLDINTALDNSVLTVTGATATGNLELALGNGVVTVTGGAGNDKFILGANYASTDTVNGGTGANILGLTTGVAAPGTNQTLVTNIQGLEISDAHTTATDSTRFGTITTFNLPAGSNGGSVTLPTASTVNFGAPLGASVDSAGTFGVTVSGTSTTDTLTFNVNDSDFGAAVTSTGAETLNLASNVNSNGSAADAGVNTFTALTLTDTAASEVVNITGTEAISFSGVVTANTLNAGTFAHDFTMVLATSSLAAAGTVTTGTGNDTVVGSGGADIINSGAGNDVVRGGAGQDIVNVGTGSDILDMEDLVTATLIAANRKTVSGVTIDGSDDTATNEVDGIRFGDVTTDGDLSDGAATAELQTVTTPANTTINGTAGVLELAFEFTSSQDLDNSTDGTNLLAGCGAATGSTACTLTVSADTEDNIIVAYQSGNAYIYFANDDAGADAGALVAGEIALVAIINGGVTVGGFVATNFNN